MIRVLHYGLSTNKGGIETYLNKLWTNIDKKNFHFDFIDTNLELPSFYEEFSSMGSKFYKITPRRISVRQNKKELDNLFRKENFDIFHCHLNTLSYIDPIKIALKYGCKVIIHSRSSNSPDSLITKTLHYINYYRIYMNNNTIVKLSVSDKAGQWLFGKRKSYKVINNGVDINKFKFNYHERETKRNELEISHKTVIGHIGTFLYPKNHKYLLEIFKEYLKCNQNAILLLVGDGPLKESIIALANDMKILDKIMFLGARADISELLSAMDILIFPSHYEGFPNIILEAQTTGLPCILSDTITNEVLVSHNCFTCNIKESPKNWVEMIKYVDFAFDRETAYKYVEEKGYSAEKEVEKIQKVYIDLNNS